MKGINDANLPNSLINFPLTLVLEFADKVDVNKLTI